MRQGNVSKIVKEIFNEDQRDRLSNNYRKYSEKDKWDIIGKRDAKRIQNLTYLLKRQPKLRGIDYFRSGLIFQHGQTKDLVKIAKQLAKRSFESGYEPGRWLYAAATDRLLMMQGKRQKFGTQFRKYGNVWELHPVQEKTTNKERKKYNVLSLQKIKGVLSSLNREGQRFGITKARIGLTREE